jgi:hypothetical protein
LSALSSSAACSSPCRMLHLPVGTASLVQMVLCCRPQQLAAALAACCISLLVLHGWYRWYYVVVLSSLQQPLPYVASPCWYCIVGTDGTMLLSSAAYSSPCRLLHLPVGTAWLVGVSLGRRLCGGWRESVHVPGWRYMLTWVHAWLGAV